MSDQDNNNQPAPRQEPPAPGKKPPIAFFVWIMIFIGIAFLLIYQLNPMSNAKTIDQNTFEIELERENILTAELTPETDNVYYVQGKCVRPIGSTGHGAPLTKKDGHYRTRIIYSNTIDKLLRKKPNLEITINNKDTLWKSLLLTVLPILLIVGLLYFLFSRQIKMAGRGAMQFGKSRARMILPDEHKITFDDVAGAEEAKEEIHEIIDYLKDPLKFKLVGGKIPKGALLIGPPGTGKTLLAKAVTGEANVPFFSISGSDFVEMFVGVGASRVRDMFEQARKHSPCLIFIDEIDAVGRSRFSGIGGGHDEREQTLNALLVEMDGMDTQEGVIILAATNRPDVLDPALLRPGRFDRQIALDLPDIKGRREILDVHIKNIKITDGIDLDRVARATVGFSGADLANLVNEAALLAARADRDAAEMHDFEEARDKVCWGRERRSKRISDRERKLTAYHEAGHCLVALNCPNSMPVHKVTIIPRGQAYLGATMHLPKEDRYTQSKQELLDEITVMMGGWAAEKIIFKDVTNGATSDIARSTATARKMVCSFGMSDKLGVMQYGERSEHIYVGRDITKQESYSEETAREIDLEIKKFLDDTLNHALGILNENSDKLEKLARELLEKETLDIAEIKKLLDIELDTDEIDDGKTTNPWDDPVVAEDTTADSAEAENEGSSPSVS